MTDEEKRILKKFDTRIHVLLSQFSILKKENADLYAELELKDKEIEHMRMEVSKYKKEYETLKLAKMIEISDSELKSAKQRITRLVREINKCIGLLESE